MTKALHGKSDEIRPCIKCMRCLDSYKKSNYFSCSVNPEAGRELDLIHWRQPVESKKTCAVIGGGPAGLTAALTLAERGHFVTIYEKTDRLGGQLNIAGIPEFKRDIRKYRDYLIHKCEIHPSVSIRLSSHISPDELQKQAYATIFLATGGQPVRPNLAGLDSTRVYSAWEAFVHPPQGNIVILGGGDVGCETALHLLDSGAAHVTIVELQDTIAPKAIFTYRMALLQRMEGRVQTFTSTEVLRIVSEGVVVLPKDGSESLLPADAVIYAVGTQSQLPAAFATLPQAVLLGDCHKPGNLYTATRSAYESAMQVL